MSEDQSAKLLSQHGKPCKNCRVECRCVPLEAPGIANLAPAGLDILPIDDLHRRQSLILPDEGSEADKFDYVPDQRDAVFGRQAQQPVMARAWTAQKLQTLAIMKRGQDYGEYESDDEDLLLEQEPEAVNDTSLFQPIEAQDSIQSASVPIKHHNQGTEYAQASQKVYNDLPGPEERNSQVNLDHEMSASHRSQLQRHAHLTRVAERIGIDSLAVCGDEADGGLFEEYNFDGLMNLPWYDRITGTEMRMFQKEKQGSRQQRQVHQRKHSSPLSQQMEAKSNCSSDLEQLKSECAKRVKRKRLYSKGSDDSSADLINTTDQGRQTRQGAGVPNKDLLKVFQNSIEEDEAKENLAYVVDRDTTNCEQVTQIKDYLFTAFKHARSEIRLGERPLRALVRLSFSLMHNLLGQLSEKELQAQAQDSLALHQTSFCESQSTRKGTAGGAPCNLNSQAPDQPSLSGEADKASFTQTQLSGKGRLAGVKRRRDKKQKEGRQISKAILLPSQQLSECRGQPNDGSIASNTSFCNRMRNLEISNQILPLTDSDSRQIIQPRRLQSNVKPGAPQVKELLTSAVCQMPEQSGTKAEIMSMAEMLHPELVTDKILQRSLDNAFSKYLEASPIRFMLLHVEKQEEEQRQRHDSGVFCLKTAVIDCLRTPEAQVRRNSLDFESLKKLLLTRYPANFALEGAHDGNLAPDVSRGEAHGDKLYSRLAKLINRNTNLFAKCAKTYQLKQKRAGFYQGHKASVPPSIP